MKTHKGLKILGIIVVCLVLFWTTINLVPPPQNVANNPFVVGEENSP